MCKSSHGQQFSLHGCGSVSVPHCSWTQCKLGGTGLRSAERTRIAAYWASWADSLAMIRQRHPDVAEQLVQELEGHSMLASGSQCSEVTAARAVASWNSQELLWSRRRRSSFARSRPGLCSRVWLRDPCNAPVHFRTRATFACMLLILSLVCFQKKLQVKILRWSLIFATFDTSISIAAFFSMNCRFDHILSHTDCFCAQQPLPTLLCVVAHLERHLSS